MNFVVKIDNLCTSLLEVEAEGQDEAREKAKEFFIKNREYILSLKDYYVSTSPPESWVIIEKDEFLNLSNELHKQCKIKESVNLLIHRAKLIEQRNNIKNRNSSLFGALEDMMVSSELLLADVKIEEEQIKLPDTEMKKLHKTLENSDDRKLLPYLDPEKRSYQLKDLYQYIENKQKQIDAINNGSYKELKVLGLQSFEDSEKDVIELCNQEALKILDQEKSESENEKSE